MLPLRHAWLHTAVVYLSATATAEVRESYYDCQLRVIARDYSREVVLRPWGSSRRALAALEQVSQGLRLGECNVSSDMLPLAAAAAPEHIGVSSAAGVTVYVATTGDDLGTGSLDNPLQTIAGAQAWIRSKYPIVSERPQITVKMEPGDYFFGKAPIGHTKNATLYSGTAMARFTAQDSGCSAAKPIVFSSTDPEGPTPARLVGGALLANLSWTPAPSSMAMGIYVTTVPDNVEFDSQDQLFLLGSTTASEHPLVRARTPNGKPWIPQDGYNLTVFRSWGELPMAPVYKQCSRTSEQPRGPCSNIPHPAVPSAGCVAAPNVTLLCGYPNIPGVLPSVSTESATACMALCQKNRCCTGYTWHDNSTGQFYKDCFLLTNSKVDAWTTAQPSAGHFSGLCRPSESTASCAPAEKNDCLDVSVVCAKSNVTQVTGSLGVTTVAGKQLVGDRGLIKVSHCLEHLLDLANDWPEWKAASYGLVSPCNSGSDPLKCTNTMYTEYNFPLWFGPWAANIEVDLSQDAGVNMSTYTWKNADQIVVHAMADGEWGGTQFKVASVDHSGSTSNPVLHFAYGGFQQARGATLGSPDGKRTGNRFYMEGSVEFLDSEGEWHFDAATRQLYVFPPKGVSLNSKSTKVILTQTDTLLEFVGSASNQESRVSNIVLANLSFSYTSAQFFRPHEETSGGDYATHRSGAIKVENATGLTFIGCDFTHIGGNAVFLSASVRNVTITQNRFEWLGTNGVAVQGKTGLAMMDGRDGEEMVAVHGASADNGVRLPKNNLVSHNVFSNYGVWDKQSAAYHKALAPGNMFLNNICFNSSRHGVNFQDGMGGGGIAEGNLMFNLNRETHDTTAFNSWNRRNYIISHSEDPAVGILVPSTHNEWRRNLVLGRDFYGIADLNGNAIRNDDGASFYTHSNNVLYAPENPGVQFNGGTQIYTRGNLYILTTAGWNLGPTPDVAGVFNDTIVDAHVMFTGDCKGFLNATKPDVSPGIYNGDWNLGVLNSTGQGPWGPPAPQPAPPPPPPLPPLGQCSTPISGWSLAVERNAESVGRTNNAAACGLLCKDNCTGYTWHDHTCTGYINACYVTFDKHAWADGTKATRGHHSAICNRGTFDDNLNQNVDMFATYFCGDSLEAWQRSTQGQDSHSQTCTNSNGECSSVFWLAKARRMLWDGQQ